MYDFGNFEKGDEMYPDRIIYIFADQCNMACSFCYMPWDRKPVLRNVAVEVLEHILSWGVKSIAFGGGDPLLYDWLGDLFTITRSSSSQRVFIQLDTNGLGFTNDKIDRLQPLVDMLGLPLDAASSVVSRDMRKHRNHARIVEELILKAVAHGFTVKVNTVVSRVNLHEIMRIGEAVERSGASIWSLYQFWPVGEYATKNVATHVIDLDAYTRIVDDASKCFSGIHIEGGGDTKTRCRSYFLLSSSGLAWTISRYDATKHVELGNILTNEEEVLRNWRAHADFGANARRVTSRVALLASAY